MGATQPSQASSKGGSAAKTGSQAKTGGVSPADLANMTAFARVNSTFVSMLFSNSQNQQALNEQLRLMAERQKVQKSREQMLRDLQSTIAKIDSDIHKNRAQTAANINKGIGKLLSGQ